MGALFRSEEMELIQLFVQPEAAYHVVASLGESGCVQFRDLNEDVSAFQREYATEVKRIYEMERQLRYIEAEVGKSEIKLHDIVELPKAPNPREIVNLEAHLEKTERDIRELAEGSTTLKREYYERIQQKHVLLKAQVFFNQQDIALEDDEEAGGQVASQLNYIAGVINKDKAFAFERMLWRVSRGNVFLRQADIEELIDDPMSGIQNRKVAFIAFFKSENLGSKINKICTGFKAIQFDVPADSSRREELIKVVSTEVHDIKTVLNQTEDHRMRLLVSVSKDIQNWKVLVVKMKAIYDTLNLFSHDVSKKCLIAEGWVPKSDLGQVDKALKDGSESCGSSVASFYNVLKTRETPPTFNRTNKFTKGFQNLISAYAFASYRELNPALYTIVTFPFLFAIMFGDLGHGIILVCFGAWLVIAEEKIAAQKNKNEIFSIFFGGRYIILLMGIFSMYTGFIYNDIFSKSLSIFGSKWHINKDDIARKFIYTQNGSDEKTKFYLEPSYAYEGTPYFAGLDPVWQDSENKIIFLNSLKMKISIIFGVVHMTFGVVLSVVNFVHFKKISHIFLDFLPKVLFFLLLFGYLLIMTAIKWFNYSAMNDKNKDTVDVHGTACAPNVLIFFIGMMLFKESEIAPPCEKYMFSGQQQIQKVLVVVAVICIPIMLFGVPIFEMIRRKGKKAVHVNQNGHVGRQATLDSIPEASALPAHEEEEEEEEEEEPMSDVMVHAGIHTIEFTLSTVSHTASYLRLWALSLAHAQLSEVLWTMVLRKALVTLSTQYVGGVFIYLIFFAWSTITIGILVLMEGLSAFLHTLRLHWVEFMSKFFEGQGYCFTPFSFHDIFNAEESEE